MQEGPSFLRKGLFYLRKGLFCLREGLFCCACIHPLYMQKEGSPWREQPSL